MPKKTAAQLQREIDQALAKKSTHADEPLQESPARKAEWLREAKRRFPVDSHVRVAKSDEPRYVGVHGTVIGYDVGLMGDWPLVRVRLAAPIAGTVDGFYGDGSSDDEIVRVREGKSSSKTRAPSSHATRRRKKLPWNYDIKETIDGEWLITIDGIQTGSQRDRSGAGSDTYPTHEAAYDAALKIAAVPFRL